MLAFPPLPTARVSYGRPGYRDFAFLLRDAEGMFPRPPGYHGAVDWFADGRTPTRAARGGLVVEVVPSRGNTGQVFGGVVKVEDHEGQVWVYRHVNPLVGLGSKVKTGQVIARVTDWRDGPDHLHLEIWKDLGKGYWIDNAIDPKTVTFTVVYRGPEDDEPPPDGDTLRLAVNDRKWAGWEDAGGPLQWIAKSGLKPDVRAAIAWRGNIWRGSRDVTNVARSLVNKFL